MIRHPEAPRQPLLDEFGVMIARVVQETVDQPILGYSASID